MRVFLGIMMCLLGIVLGIYLGLYVCFVGGIVSIIDGARAPVEADAGMIAWGIVKILFAGTIGVCSAALLILPGAALASSEKKENRLKTPFDPW